MATDKTMLLRVEYGVINGNRKWQDILEKNFFNELIKQEQCFKGKGYNDGHSYFHYYCKKDTDLSTFSQIDFIINDLGLNITLTKDDLFIEENDKLFFLIIFGHPQPILGLPVFKKYQFIFNQDTNTIGLYKTIIGEPSTPKPSRRSNSDNQNKPGSYKLIIFLLFFVIIILCIYVFRNYITDRKKKQMKMILNEKNKEIQLVSYEKMDN